MRPVAQLAHPPFDGIRAPQTRNLRPGEDGVMADGVDVRVDIPDLPLPRHPADGIEAREVDGAGIGAQGLFPVVQEVLVEERERQLADAPVDGLAVPQHPVVRLADGAPAPVDAEEGNDVVEIVSHRAQIHDERAPSGHAQHGGRERRSLHAVRATLPQHLPRGEARVLPVLEVMRDRAQEILDLPRCIAGTDDGELFAREAVVHGEEYSAVHGPDVAFRAIMHPWRLTRGTNS